MTHFRFRLRKTSYIRWRCRTARCRTVVLLLLQSPATRYAPSMAAWRRTIPVFVPVVPVAVVLQVGEFVVSEEGDPKLSGHPDIRY